MTTIKRLQRPSDAFEVLDRASAMQGEKPAQTVTRQRSLKLLVDEMLANPNMVPYQVSYPSPTQPYVGVVALDVGTGRINVLGKWRH